MSSDERLVKRAAKGDSRAFEAIYQRYQQELYRFCLAMVGDRQDAQDALQNTMVKVLRALPGEDREIKLKPWLYRIARNESVETLRKRRDNVELEPHQTVAVGVTETAEARERLRTLLADLEQLPERQRAVLVMRELSGLDFDQIGAAFETSSAVARQTLYEARLSLRQLEAGREMRCTDVMKEISDADGRVTRRREIRAHLRGCAECRAFRDDIARRHEDLAGLTPLPLAASAALLQGVLGKGAAASSAAAGGGGLAGSVGAGAGHAVATSAIVKSAATVAVVAVVGVSAADRGGLVDLPIPGGGSGGASETSEPKRSPDSDGPAGGDGAYPASQTAADGHPNDSKTGGQGEEGRGGGDVPPSRPENNAGATRGNDPSNSQAGLNPPGGGHGSSAAQRKGRPDELPGAADHGQQTAAAKKAGAASPPGKGASAQPGSQRGDSGPPENRPPPASEAKVPPDVPAAGPPADPSAQDGSGVGQKGPATTPPVFSPE